MFTNKKETIFPRDTELPSPSLTHSLNLGCSFSAGGEKKQESDSRGLLSTLSYSMRTMNHVGTLLPKKPKPKS